MNKEQIQQEFDEILTGFGYEFWDDDMCKITPYLNKRDFIEILEQAFNLGLEVAADNAEADVTILTEDGQYEMDSIQLGYDYEVYVLKNSILKFKL